MTFRPTSTTSRRRPGSRRRTSRPSPKEKGLLKPDVKAGKIVAWLNEDFGLGRGHAMAIYALLKPDMGKT